MEGVSVWLVVVVGLYRYEWLGNNIDIIIGMLFG